MIKAVAECFCFSERRVREFADLRRRRQHKSRLVAPQRRSGQLPRPAFSQLREAVDAQRGAEGRVQRPLVFLGELKTGPQGFPQLEVPRARRLNQPLALSNLLQEPPALRELFKNPVPPRHLRESSEAVATTSPGSDLARSA
jgi:hypothetical protein